MASRKTYPGMGGVPVTRSEFEDGILRDNARHDNRLNNEKRSVEKAKRVVVKGYDKESQLLKQKMATAAQRKTTSYFNQSGHTPASNGSANRSSGVRMTTGRTTRFIPDYEYRQYRQKHRSAQEFCVKQTTNDDPALSPENEAESQENGKDFLDGHQLATDVDDRTEEYVSTRKVRPPDEFWNNLSAPKHQSSVRSVRERLAKEFGKPKPKSSQRSNGSSVVPAVQGTRLGKK